MPHETLKKIFPRRLKKRDLVERVYDNLKNMILSGKLMKGERLAEERLAQEFNVSRTPIRGAFLQLEKDRLIARKDKKRAFVA